MQCQISCDIYILIYLKIRQQKVLVTIEIAPIPRKILYTKNFLGVSMKILKFYHIFKTSIFHHCIRMLTSQKSIIVLCPLDVVVNYSQVHQAKTSSLFYPHKQDVNRGLFIHYPLESNLPLVNSTIDKQTHRLIVLSLKQIKLTPNLDFLQSKSDFLCCKSH